MANEFSYGGSALDARRKAAQEQMAQANQTDDTGETVLGTGLGVVGGVVGGVIGGLPGALAGWGAGNAAGRGIANLVTNNPDKAAAQVVPMVSGVLGIKKKKGDPDAKGINSDAGDTNGSDLGADLEMNA